MPMAGLMLASHRVTLISHANETSPKADIRLELTKGSATDPKRSCTKRFTTYTHNIVHKHFFVLIVAAAFMLEAEARGDLDCRVHSRSWVGGEWPAFLGKLPLNDQKYWSKWSKDYQLDVSFLAGLEFRNGYRRDQNLDDYNLYAAIWFSQDNVAIIELGSAVNYVDHKIVGSTIKSGIDRMGLASWFTLQDSYNTAQGRAVVAFKFSGRFWPRLCENAVSIIM